MAPLTAPFVLTAWLLLFAVCHFGQLHPTNLIGSMPVQPVAVIQTDLEEAAGIGGRRLYGGQLRQRIVPRSRRGVPSGQPLDRRGPSDRDTAQLSDLFRLGAAGLGAWRADRADAR